MTKTKRHEVSQKPWERQTWDTAAGYRNFHTYYLPQPIPRSIDTAYRAYKAVKDGHDLANAWDLPGYKKFRATGGWRNWAHALKPVKRGGKPKKIPGAIGWTERAAAFDDYLARQTEALWLAREMESREEDWAVSVDLREAGRAILAEHDKFLRTSSKFVKGDISQGVNDREIITLKLNTPDGIRMLELAHKMGRAAANIEDAPRRIIAEIDKELEYILAIIEQVVDEATFSTILTAIQAGGDNSPASTEETTTQESPGV